jgi:hypothetical protein
LIHRNHWLIRRLHSSPIRQGTAIHNRERNDVFASEMVLPAAETR